MIWSVFSLVFVFMAPVASADSGCWVKMYSKEHFRGRAIVFYGARSVDDLMEVEDHYDIVGFDSFVVGPDAKIRVYSRRDFRGDHLTFRPNARVSEIDDIDVDPVESFRVWCRPKPPAEPEEPEAEEPETEEPEKPETDEPETDQPESEEPEVGEPEEGQPEEDEPSEDPDSPEGDEEVEEPEEEVGEPEDEDLPRRYRSISELERAIDGRRKLKCGYYKFGSRKYVQFIQYEHSWKITTLKSFTRRQVQRHLLKEDLYTARDNQIIDAALDRSGMTEMSNGDYFYLQRDPSSTTAYVRLGGRLIRVDGLSHLLFRAVGDDIRSQRAIKWYQCN